MKWNFPALILGISVISQVSVLAQLAPPVLQSPSNNSNVSGTTVTFSWQSVTGAAEYWIQISTNSGFTSLVLDQSVGTSSSVNTSGFANTGQQYWWRLRTKNSSGTWGSYNTSPYTFTNGSISVLSAPVLLTPANSSTSPGTTVSFYWQSVTGAAEYWIQISTNSGFTALVLDQSVAMATSMNISGFLNNGQQYWWKLKTKNSAGVWGSYNTSPFTFTNGSVSVLAAPALLTPVNNSNISGTSVSFSWQSVSGAAEYWVQISKNSSFTVLVLDQSVGTTTTMNTSGFLDNGQQYWWRLRTKNSAGVWGSYNSSPYVFTNGAVPVLAAPSLLTPVNESNITGVSVSFSWQSVSGAAEYWIQISTNSGFTALALDQSMGTETTVNTSGFLDNGQQYWWRLRTKNSAGVWGSYNTSPFTFTNGTVSVLPAPILLTPANNSNVPGTSVSFSWQSVTGAAEYWIQASTNNGFTALVLDQSAGTSTSVNTSGFLNTGQPYWWRLRTKNSAGIWGSYNASPFTFTNGAVTPVITLITPDKASAGTNTQVTITGTNFETSQGTGKVEFFTKSDMARLSAPVISWSNTQIVCTVPIGTVSGYPYSAGSGPVTVTNNSGQTSNGYNFKVTFGYGLQKWNGSAPVVPFRINENYAGITGEGAGIQAAANTWNNAGASFTMIYAGTHTSTSNSVNGVNEILWADLEPGVLGQSSISGSGGYITECDFSFNSDYSWSVSNPTPAGQIDIQTIAVHELGHWLFLRDLYGDLGDNEYDRAKTMYGFGSAGSQKRNLHADDISGIQYIYGTSSCNLTVSQSTTNVTATAGTGTFQLIFSGCSNQAWTVSDDASWLSVSPASGSGSQNITFTYQANSTCSARTANITVTASGAAGSPKTITVIQAAGTSPVLSVTPSNQNVTSQTGSTTFAISNTGCGTLSWTASSNQTWCTLSSASGAGNTTLTATYSANSTGSSRTATITVNATGLNPVTVTVTQTAASCVLSVLPASQSVVSAAGSTSFTVSSECAWTAASNQSWCTLSQVSGTGISTVTASFTANSGVTRTATITVTATGVSGSPQSVTVIQGTCAHNWQPVQFQQNNMNVIAKLYIDHILSTNPADAVGAFVGTECRGIGHPDPALGGIIFLTITSNVQSGETITFKEWNSSKCQEVALTESISFTGQTDVGTISNPFLFSFGQKELCIDFPAGYKWFSVNLDPGSMNLNTLFSSLRPCENDRIIGQNSFATFYGGAWVGSLTSLDAKYMYKMKLCSAQTCCIQGSPVTVLPISIPGNNGYLWIGYMPQNDLAINTAMGNITPTPMIDDRFNAQSSFGTFSGSTWIGSLTTLQRSGGYIIRMQNASVLNYPSGSTTASSELKSTDIEKSTANGDNLKINTHYNMQVIGRIIMPEGRTSMDSADEVYAYVGNECRGIAHVDSRVNGRLFLTIGSNIESGEKVNFRVFISHENQLYNLGDEIIFESEKEMGEISRPYVFNLAQLTGITLTPQDGEFKVGNIYPNPFNIKANVDFSLSKPGRIEAVIINSLGQVMKRVVNKEMNSGNYSLDIDRNGLTPGFYQVVFTCKSGSDESVVTKRMIVN